MLAKAGSSEARGRVGALGRWCECFERVGAGGQVEARVKQRFVCSGEMIDVC